MIHTFSKFSLRKMKVNSCQSETIGPDLATTNKSKTNRLVLCWPFRHVSKTEPCWWHERWVCQVFAVPGARILNQIIIYCNGTSYATVESLLVFVRNLNLKPIHNQILKSFCSLKHSLHLHILPESVSRFLLHLFSFSKFLRGHHILRLFGRRNLI